MTSIGRSPTASSVDQRKTREAGFVITLEFLLIMAVFVIPLLIGIFLLGRKAYTLYLNQREFIEQPYSRAVVWDSTPVTPKVVGPVVGYNQLEEPQVVFRDAATQGGFILGVRRSRLTTHGVAFYPTADCTGSVAYVRRTGIAVVTGATGEYPPAGFAGQMNAVSYAMGSENILYSSAATTGGSNGGALAIQSVYISQDMSVPGGSPSPPCFAVASPASVTGLVAGTAVIDFGATGNYVTPFRLAFPSPGTLPVLPARTGG